MGIATAMLWAVMSIGPEGAVTQSAQTPSIQITAEGVARPTEPPVVDTAISFTSVVDAFIEFPSSLAPEQAQAQAFRTGALAAAPGLRLTRCLSDPASVCVELDLPAATTRTVPLAALVAFAPSVEVQFVAHRRDRAFFTSSTGSIRLAPAGYQVLRVEADRVTRLSEQPGHPICDGAAPPRRCAGLRLVRTQSGPPTVEIEAIQSATPLSTPAIQRTTACAAEGSRACLVASVVDVATIEPRVLEEHVAVPLRARSTAPPGTLTTTGAQAQRTTAGKPVFVTISGDGVLDPSVRNPTGPLEIGASRPLGFSNFGNIDVRVEVRIPARVAASLRQARGKVTSVPCVEGGFQCIRVVVYRDRTEQVDARIIAVSADVDARIEVRSWPDLVETSRGSLRIKRDPDFVGMLTPPPPPPTPPPGPAPPPPAGAEKKEPETTLEFVGDFSFSRLADFDSDNDGQDLISAADPFTGGYSKTLRGKGNLQLRRSYDALEGSIDLVFQDAVFGGLDNRLLPGTGQPTLARTSSVTRTDDPVSIESWFVKVNPFPTWFLQVGRMSFPTSPDNIAGVEAGEGLQFSVTPGARKPVAISAGYVVIREGLNGVPDRHERDADTFAVDASWDLSKHDVLAYPPQFTFAWRRTSDRGRDVGSSDPTLLFDPETHPFHGTRRRWTAGLEYVQRLPRTTTFRVAFYRSRLTPDDVAATAAKQEGRGHVLRASLQPPAMRGVAMSVFYLRGSRDDAETTLLNEGFLGNEQRRFSERGRDAALNADSVFFQRMATALQVRPIGTAFAPALGLSNKTYAGASWNGNLQFPSPPSDDDAEVNTNPLRNLTWIVRYRAIWQSDLGEASGFAGHEVALRITGNGATANGAWTPYAGLVYYRPGAAMESFLSNKGVFQAFVGASLKIPLLSRRGNP